MKCIYVPAEHISITAQSSSNTKSLYAWLSKALHHTNQQAACTQSITHPPEVAAKAAALLQRLCKGLVLADVCVAHRAAGILHGLLKVRLGDGRDLCACGFGICVCGGGAQGGGESSQKGSELCVLQWAGHLKALRRLGLFTAQPSMCLSLHPAPHPNHKSKPPEKTDTKALSPRPPPPPRPSRQGLPRGASPAQCPSQCSRG